LFERGVLFCVTCVICVLCLIVIPLLPRKNLFAVKLNNNNNKYFNDFDSNFQIIFLGALMTSTREKISVALVRE
jgi:hypothetical protein